MGKLYRFSWCVAVLQKGYTALHVAGKYGSVEVAGLLVQRAGVDVDAPALNGLTPLHVATHYGNYSVARLLLAHAASPRTHAQVLYYVASALDHPRTNTHTHTRLTAIFPGLPR